MLGKLGDHGFTDVIVSLVKVWVLACCNNTVESFDRPTETEIRMPTRGILILSPAFLLIASLKYGSLEQFSVKRVRYVQRSNLHALRRCPCCQTLASFWQDFSLVTSNELMYICTIALQCGCR